MMSATQKKTPKVEIKKIQIVDRLSEETLCFSAKIYVGGKAVGEARNHGHGGSTDWWIVDPKARELVEAFATEATRGAKYLFDGPVAHWVDDQVHAAWKAKETRRVERLRDKNRRDFIARGEAFFTEIDHANGVLIWTGCKTVERARSGIDLMVKHSKHGKVARWAIYDTSQDILVEEWKAEEIEAVES